MARIPLTNVFTPISEGYHVFRIWDAKYDEEFGKIEIKLVNAQGQTHTEKYNIINNNNEPNEKALAAFSYFAKTALNDFTVSDVDPVELIDCYIKAEVRHTTSPSRNNPDKEVTFVNLGDKESANCFDEEPIPKALTIGKADSSKSTKYNLDELLK